MRYKIQMESFSELRLMRMDIYPLKILYRSSNIATG